MALTATRKLNSWLVWIISALLVIALVDAIPDPPAIDQHSSKTVISQIHKAPCNPSSRLPSCVLSCPSSQFIPADSLAYASPSEPALPSLLLIETGLASDPSPPALQSSEKHLFQS